MKKLILVCGLLTSGFSFGADWIFIGSSKGGDKFYIDYDYYNYDKKSNVVKLWYKVEEKHNGVYYTEEKTLAEYYCGGNGRSKVLSAVYYHPNGEVKNTFESNYYTESTVVFPDTTGEFLHKVACGTPGKGLDFKYLNLEQFDSYYEYIRAQNAYLREPLPQGENDLMENFVPNIKIENYYKNNKVDIDQYNQDRGDALKKIRQRNIQKKYK